MAGSRWTVPLVLLAIFAGIYLLFECTPLGHAADEAAFRGLPPLDNAARGGLEAARFGLLGAAALAAVVVAVLDAVRRRWRAILLAALIAALSIVGSVVAKQLLPRPRFNDVGYPWNTFPSDHMSATLSLFLAIGVLRTGTGGRARGTRIAIIALGTVTGWVQIASLAHRASDVIGAAVLVAAAAAASCAITGGGAVVSPQLQRPAIAGAAGALLLALALVIPRNAPAAVFAALGTVLLVLASVALAAGIEPRAERDLTR